MPGVPGASSSGTWSQPPRPITIVSSSPRALLADAAVADVNDAVGDRRGRGVVAHDERRGALFPRELGEEIEHVLRRRLVELARRLVRHKKRRRRREGGTERDPLLLATRELAGPGVGAVEKIDPLEQLARPAGATRAPGRLEGRAGGRRAPRR